MVNLNDEGLIHRPNRAAAGVAAPQVKAAVSRRTAFGAVAICWLLVVFDGFDLISYGAVQNQIIETTDWGLNAASAGTLGAMAFLGMMIGALGAGRISDRIGRKRTILACAVVFSVFTALCAIAPGAIVFGVFRFIAGLGLGGLVPSANAIASELVPQRWRSAIATLMMSGVPIGGTLAALVGIGVIPTFGWQAMFVLGIIPLIVLVPIGIKTLPETLAAVTMKHSNVGFGGLLKAPYLGASVLFAIATLFTLFAWYGLGTQLPKIMRDSGYDLGSALLFTVALNLGAVLGSVITAWAGGRFGAVPTGIIGAGLAGVSLVSLVQPQDSVWVVYLLLILAGVGTHGTQCLIIAAIASSYPAHLRGTSLGWALGIGRIGAVIAPPITGFMLANPNLDTSASFLLFGGAAIAAAITLLGVLGFVRKSQTTDATGSTTTTQEVLA